MLRWSLPLLLLPILTIGQECTSFIPLLGQRDISQEVIGLKEHCGPFIETISADGTTKTWASEEQGITLHFINRAKNRFNLPKFEVLMVELLSFTDEGGYRQEFPLGFTLGMDNRMVKEHIMQMQNVQYERKDLGKRSASFIYIGISNATALGRKVHVSISEYDGKSISSMRLRLK